MRENGTRLAFRKARGANEVSIKYKAPKGSRRKKNCGYCGVTTFDDYWFVTKENRWIPSEKAKGERSTHFYGVRSVRAFRRRLRQWSKYLPKGVEFILASIYDCYCVSGTTQNEDLS
jgi:hypothetical protein